MSNHPSDSWTPTYGSYSTFTPTDTQTPLSPRYSYTSRSDHSAGDDSQQHTVVSPRNSASDDMYTDDDSLDEVEASLNTIDDETTPLENSPAEWSHARSYTPSGSYTGSYTGTYSGTYTGSTSYTSLPTFRTRTPQAVDPRIRLSRITERTEESRPVSGAFSSGSGGRPANPTPDAHRRSTLAPVGTPSSGHSRASTDPSGDRTLPPPGRATELIAVFETQSGHSRGVSAPGGRSASPFPSSATDPTTSYGYGSTGHGYGSRPSSPTKSSGSSGSYPGPESRPTQSGMFSPPTRVGTSDYTRTGSYFTPSSYTSPGTFTDTATRGYTSNTLTGTDTVTGVNTGTLTTATYTDTGSTLTPTSVAALRRPQTSPRSPLTSVRNLVSAWKERTPAPRPAGDKPSGSISTSPPVDTESLADVRRRMQRAGARLRESSGFRPSSDSQRNSGGSASIRSSRSGVLPPGFDLGQFSSYTQSTEAPLHIGLLWYLNVHAAPPYRWQRCQALLYPHMLLLSWLAPGGGRGIVALDLLNCTSVQSAPSPTHPSARDDVGTVAARIQGSEQGGQPLMDMLVPFHMIYADGVERLAAESLLERQRWANRIWEAINRPVSTQDSQLTRSPTSSIRTISSTNSRSSTTSVGSRSTVFVPPLSSLPDISDYPSEGSPLSRQLSFVSSHHTGTVDDNVIRNDRYVYPGDPRVVAPGRGNSLRRSGSMTDMDSEFNTAIDRARGSRSNMQRMFEYSPVSVSSGSSLGKDIFVTPPPSSGRGSDRARSEVSDEAFFSAGTSSGTRSNVSSTYYSPTDWTDFRTTSGLRSDTFTPSSGTQVVPSTSSYLGMGSTSYLGTSHEDSVSITGTSPSTLSRARAVARRVRAVSRSGTSTYTDESSDKENVQSSSTLSPPASLSETYTPGASTFTPGSEAYDLRSGSYTPGSATYTGTYTPGSNTYTGTYTPSSQNGSYTPGSGAGSYTPGSGTGSYTISGSGSRTSQSGSGSYTPSSGSGSYTPGSLVYGSGTYTPGSGTYSGADGPVVSASSSSNSFTQGSETGYDICPSSDFTSLTRSSYSETITVTPLRSIASDQISEVASGEYLTVSQGSSEYLTPGSGISSPTSFKSFPTISDEADYVTAPSISASEPSSETEYQTAPQPPTPDYPTQVEVISEPEIPPESRLSPSSLSSLTFSDGRNFNNIPTPSEIPTIPSPRLSISDLQPEEVPLPPSLPAHSPVPSSLSPTEEFSEATTPTSLRTTGRVRGPTRVLAEVTRGRPQDVGSEFELLSSLPETEELETPSVITPSSIPTSSGSTPRSLPPPAPAVPATTISSPTSISTSIPSSSITPAVSPLIPRRTRRWAEESDLSYESSVLLPSPSLRSLVIHDGPDVSYETSFLRPSGSSVSSIDRLSTIPQSPSPSTSLAPESPLPPLTPVPALPSSISSRSDVETPSSLSAFSTNTASSLVRTPSTTSSSFVSQSELESSIFDSSSLADTEEEEVLRQIEVPPMEQDEDEFGTEPSTEPSLLSTPPSSEYARSGTATPVPVPPPQIPSVPSIPSLTAPDGSGVVSVSTYEGPGSPDRLSLKTESSESIQAPRDIGRDLDRLADDLRRYHDTRGEENRGLGDNLQALRDELRELSDFLHRTPPSRQPLIIRQEGMPRTFQRAPRMERPVVFGQVLEVPESRTALVDEAVGTEPVMTEIFTVEGRDSTVTVTRSSSTASSVSFLSSHHSDDDLFPEDSEISIGWPSSERGLVGEGDSEGDSEISSTSSFTSSLETSIEDASTPTPTPPSPSPSPVEGSPATTSSLSTPTVRPRAQLPEPSLDNLMDLLRNQLGDLRDQINALSNEQGSTNRMLDMLRTRPIPPPVDNAELSDRLRRIEDLIQHLVDQAPREQVIIEAPLPPLPESERAESIMTSTNSLDEIRELLRTFAPQEAPTLHMPIPSQPGLSIAQQLDEILSSSVPPVPSVNFPPPLQPFVYRPTHRGTRPRSASPISLETLPPRPFTAPAFPDTTYSDPRGVGPRAARPHYGPRSRRSPSITETEMYYVPGSAAPHFVVPPTGDLEGEFRRRRPRQPVPPPRPIIDYGDIGRSPTAPPGTGGARRPPESWYQRRGQPTSQQVPGASRVAHATQPPQPPHPSVQYVPMPQGPTQVQMPPVFDSLMEILRENRLAQLATVDQQRELMRYMHDLNEWLGRDVRDRQAEIRGVNARIESLRQELRFVGMRGGLATTISSSSESDSTPPQPSYIIGAPRVPMPEPTFGPVQPPMQMGYPPTGPPVIPPVIPPGDQTPQPGFPPVVPGVQPPLFLHQPGGVAVIPGVVPEAFRPVGSHHPTPIPGRASSMDRVPFIPSLDGGSPRSEAPQMIPPMGMHHMPSGTQLGPTVIQMPGSPSSSSTTSTHRSGPSRHRSHRSGRSGTSRGHRRGRSRSRSRSRSTSHSDGRSRSRSRTTRTRSSRTRRSSSPRTHRSSRRRPRSYTPSRSPTPIIIQQPGAISQPPVVHVQPPTVPSIVTGSPRYPEQQLPAPQPTIIIQQPGQQGQLGMPGVPPQAPTMIPMPSGPGSIFQPPGSVHPQPVIIQTSGRSSRSSSPRTHRSSGRTRSRSRSRSRSRRSPRRLRRSRRHRSRSYSPSRSRSRSPRYHHSRRSSTTPPGLPPQPVIVHTRSRSHSYSPSRRYEPQPTQPTVVIPQQPFSQGPPVVIPGSPRSYSTRSRRRRRGSRSSTPPAPVIVQQPFQPAGTLPTFIPQAPTSQAPPLIIPGAAPQQTQQPIVIQPSRSRSHSPRHPVTPMNLPTAPSRGRSRSPSRSHRHRSRSPSHYQLPPPGTQFVPSRYPSRRSSRSPTRVVVGDPYGRHERRRYSPEHERRRSHRHYSRSRSRSPSYREHERRPRSRTPERDRRHHRRSPSRYSRSPSPQHPRTRSRSPRRDFRRSRSRSPDRGSPARSHYTSTRHPSTRRPSTRILSHAHTPRSESPSILPVPAPGTHPISHVGSVTSDPRHPIVVVPPSRADSRISHRPPTIVSLGDQPEDIHPQDPHRPLLSRTPTGRRPSDGRYTPTPSIYEAEDYQRPHSPARPHSPVRHVPSDHPVTVIPRQLSTARRHSPDVGRISPIPSVRRPSDGVPHEVANIPLSEAEHSDYEGALPVRPPRGSIRRSPSVSVIHPPPRRETVTPLDLHAAEEERERSERLGAIERHLHDTALAAAQAEDEREAEFRRNEEHRERIFLDSQERRDQESRERADHIWDTIESRLHALPPPREPSSRPRTPRTPRTPMPDVHPPTPRPVSEAEEIPADRASIASVTSMVSRVASEHARDILETVRLEREEFSREREAAAAERERLMADAEEARGRLQEDQESRIRALENELASVKAELENERQAKLTGEADIRERERAEFAERDEALRAQLSDITNLLNNNTELCYQKKADSDTRYQEKLSRRPDKEAQYIELRDMVQKIHDDLDTELRRARDERLEAASKPTLESIVEELRHQNAEQRELLRQLSDSWRADCERHHQETIEAVKQTAQEQVPFNVQGYLDEFSKALAAEVRMLLGEVGKLREERRNLQHEMGFLLCMKSKYGPGGEFQPEWQPSTAAPPPPDPPVPPPEAPMPPDLPPPAAKPGWRQIGKRRGKKKDASATQAPAPQPAPTHHMDPRRQVTQSWATWHPDPNQAPTPPSVEANLMVPHPSSPGLFGPRTPSNKSWE